MHSEEVERARQLESICWVLLRRYGVVLRDVLAHETIIPRWRELLMAFRRLEDRGEIRGGRFVSGFVGEQFAMPEAVESLRASKNRSKESEVLVLCAADPLNLIGTILPGKRTPATSSNSIMLKDGAEYHPPSKEKSRPA
jgi:ATP-dependent Lhr-like helicase